MGRPNAKPVPPEAVSPRLLLVEFSWARECRNETSMFFPFYKAHVRALGVDALWVRFGVDASREARTNRLGFRVRQFETYRVAPGDFATLREYGAAFRATHVLVSAPFPEGLDDALRSLNVLAIEDLGVQGVVTFSRRLGPRPGLSSGGRPIHVPDSGEIIEDWGRTGWLERWLGLGAASSGAGELLVETVEPDPVFVPANARAFGAPTPRTVLSGTACAYGRRVRGAPFDALDPDLRSWFVGCSFCHGAQPWVSSPGADPLPLVTRQLAALKRALPPEPGGRLELDLYDARLLSRLGDIARVLDDLGLPPVTLLISCRLDEFLAAAEALRAALPALARRGDRLRVFTMGVENLSVAENARLNKGLATGVVEQALALTRSLAHDAPATFEFQPESFILFTPWTTVADLEANFDRAAGLGFDPDGRWLITALQLYPDRAAAWQAAADGIQFPAEFDDLAMELASTPKAQDYVIPWRFAHPEVLAIARLVVRHWARSTGDFAEAFGDDALLARINGWAFADRPPTTLEFAQAVVREARVRPGDAEDLLDRALVALGGQRGAPASVAAAAPAALAPPADPPAWRDALADRLSAHLAAHPGAPGSICAGRVGKDLVDGVHVVRLRVQIGGDGIDLRAAPPRAPGAAFVRTDRFSIVIEERTPPRSGDQARQLSDWLVALDRDLAGSDRERSTP